MPMPYDVTTKTLFDSFPADWLELAECTPAGPVRVIDADLSALVAEADKVLRVDDPAGSWLAHLEWQTSHDLTLPDRMLKYSVLLQDRHRLPTRSIVVLLRPKADGDDLTGSVRRATPDGVPYLEFRYNVIRAWRQPVEAILTGGLGTLPLAPVADLGGMPLAEVVRRVRERIAPTRQPTTGLLWTATATLMGLVHAPDLIETLLRGVRDMEDSAWYQMILNRGVDRGRLEGRTEGRLEEARRMLLLQGEAVFGPADAATAFAITAINQVERIEDLVKRFKNARDWHDLLGAGDGPN